MTGTVAEPEDDAQLTPGPAHRRSRPRVQRPSFPWSSVHWPSVSWRAMWPGVVFFAASRAVVAATLYAAPVFHPGYSRTSFFGDWDAAHYLNIAQHGYPPLYPKGGGFDASAAFFPLLPLLVRAVHDVTQLSYVASGALVANVATLAAFCVIWILARDVLGEDRGRWCVAFVAFWPATFALSMVYSDGLLLTFAGAALWAMRHQRWLLAAALGFLAGLSRPDAIVLAASAAWLALAAWRRTGRRDAERWLPWIAAVGAPLGFVTYLAYTWAALGSPTAWFTAERKGWHNSFDFGRTWFDNARIAVHHPTARIDLTILTLGGIIGLALLVWMLIERLPPPMIIYAGGVLLLGIGSGDGNSIPRYVLDAFPLFMAPAARLRPTTSGAVVGLSAGALAVFMLIVDVAHRAIP